MDNEDFWNFVSDLTELLSAMEEARLTELDAIRKLKEQIAKLVGVAEDKETRRWSWDPSKIRWQKTQGFRGEYERYPLEGEKIESTPDYKALLEDLKRHDGKLTRDGMFYWLFEDSSTIGRKPRKFKGKSEEEASK